MKQTVQNKDHPKYIAVVMQMFNLIEYSDNYSKTFGSLWQYYGDESVTNNSNVIIDFLDDPDSDSFKSKRKITDQTGNY